MNNIEFIDKQIDIYISVKNRAILQIPDEDDETELCKLQDKIDICNERISYFQQIRKEIELVELIKIGCTGVKYNSDGGSVIKLGNINAMDFCKISDILFEICDWEEEDAEN